VSAHPATRSYHRVLTRLAGAERFIEFHLQVDGSSTVDESHRVTQELEAAICKRLPGAHVTIHVEPARQDTQAKPPRQIRVA
jgi:divalent metal cation (Fe/Co/Zn/Cd) transporter